MTAEQFIAEFKALPLEQRQQVIEAILRADDTWVPESFRQGMKDIGDGPVVDMETALREKPHG